MRRILLAAGLAALVLGSACSGGGSSGGSEKQSTGPSVAVDTFMFSPRQLQVRVGDTVTWTNHDDILHTVTSGTRDYDPGDSGKVAATRKSGQFDDQLDGKGATAKVTFTTPGTVHYFCDRHPGMEADVTVT